MNFALKVFENDRMIERARTHSYRRFLKILRTINWQNGSVKVYLRVNYGKHGDHSGKISSFWNDGEYETKKEVWSAFNAFKEERKA